MKRLLLAILFAACAQREQPATEQQPAAPAAPPVQAPAAAVQEHTIDVTAEFTPASVSVKAAQPVRLHFRRGDKPTCADEIVIPDLGIRKKLAANQTVTIDLPPQQAKTLQFVCGMNMMKGSVVVQ